MSSPRLEALRRQFTDVKDGIAVIESKATDAKRDLTDAEQTDVDALYVRAEALKPEIDVEAARQDSISASAAVLARIQPDRPVQTRSAAVADAPKVSAGEYLSLLWRSAQGDTDAGDLLVRAVAQQTMAQNPAIIPTPIVGDLIKFADDLRPVFNSLTGRPMPSAGKSFTRPRITQRVNVAVQALELDELVSRQMLIAGDEVVKKTYGGVLELSEQDLDWTDPGILQIVLTDFAGMYAEVTEIAACTALVALAVPTSPWSAVDIDAIVGSLTTGIGVVYAAAKRMPDTVWLSLDEMLTLAGNTNPTTNVSALSLIKQALNDAGVPLKFVTGPSLPAGTRILGASGLIESYEQVKGMLSAQNVSHLGLDVAYRGYATFYGRPEGFVGLDGA